MYHIFHTCDLGSRKYSYAKQNPKPTSKKEYGERREFDPAKYSTRLIALKLAYLGKYYNGFEHHNNNPAPRPTIEEELWKALYKCKLIYPTDTKALEAGQVSWEGCEYSKCGRTDKGVSAFGQVIGIRVRSNRPVRKRKDSISLEVDSPADNNQGMLHMENGLELGSLPLSSNDGFGGFENFSVEEEDLDSFDPIGDEIHYPTVLNNILPPDIRILAWCPAPPVGFSARFSCKERQYKYFFTQPAFPPIPIHLEVNVSSTDGQLMKDGWLDIEAMREAAKAFVGVHDFRNFCKVDASKQITNFMRRIYHADIVEEDATTTLGFINSRSFLPGVSRTSRAPSDMLQNPKVYSFTLHGSAFLWHQVRHMVAILFLAGQGLESPHIVSQLLDVEKHPRRPKYEMADDTPLVLWNCVFPNENDEERKDALKWLYIGDEAGQADAKYGPRGLMKDLWKIWRERKIDEVLAGTLIDVVAAQGADVESLTAVHRKGTKSQEVFRGGNMSDLQGIYIPVMKKPQLESVEEINHKYAVRKGFDSPEDMKEQGFRRVKRPVGIVDYIGE